MTLMDLINDLARYGGAIVSSDACSEMEIVNAELEHRFAITNEEGLGFVRRPQKWLELKTTKRIQS